MSYTSRADLGGSDVRAPIVVEPENERFHADWEPMALALTLAMGASGSWNIDMSRSARETLPDYADLSYYEIWLAALERLLLERGLVTVDELRFGQALEPGRPLVRVLRAQDVSPALARGSPTLRASAQGPAFAPGQRVRMREGVFDHHTRLPRYVRGKVGEVTRHHGAHVFADAHAQGFGEQPQHLYTVVFGAAQVWDEPGDADVQLSIDAWEPYMELAR